MGCIKLIAAYLQTQVLSWFVATSVFTYLRQKEVD